MAGVLSRQETIDSLLIVDCWEDLAIGAAIVAGPVALMSVLASGILRQPGFLTYLRGGQIFNQDIFVRWLNYGGFFALPFGIVTAIMTSDGSSRAVLQAEADGIRAWRSRALADRIQELKTPMMLGVAVTWGGALLSLPVLAILNRTRLLRFLLSAALGSVPIVAFGGFGGNVAGALASRNRSRT